LKRWISKLTVEIIGLAEEAAAAPVEAAELEL
jgi:hypothetical protein